MSTFGRSFSRGLGYGLAISLIQLFFRRPLWILLLLGALYFGYASKEKIRNPKVGLATSIKDVHSKVRQWSNLNYEGKRPLNATKPPKSYPSMMEVNVHPIGAGSK